MTLEVTEKWWCPVDSSIITLIYVYTICRSRGHGQNNALCWLIWRTYWFVFPFPDQFPLKLNISQYWLWCDIYITVFFPYIIYSAQVTCSSPKSKLLRQLRSFCLVSSIWCGLDGHSTSPAWANVQIQLTTAAHIKCNAPAMQCVASIICLSIYLFILPKAALLMC